MPAELQVSELEPEMRVIHPIYSGGSLLVHAGTVLTENLIATLQRRGVECAIVETPEDADEDVIDESDDTMVIRRYDPDLSQRATDTMNKALAKLDAQFEGLDNDPVMRRLKAAAASFWQKKIKDWDTTTRVGGANGAQS